MTLCTLAALPVIVWLVSAILRWCASASRLSRRASSLWMSLAEERLDAVPVVHAFDAEARERQAFRRRAEKSAAWRRSRCPAGAPVGIRRSGRWRCPASPFWGSGTWLINSGAMTVGALVAFIGTVGSLYAPIRSLAKAAGRFQSAAAGAQRVAELMDRSEPRRGATGGARRSTKFAVPSNSATCGLLTPMATTHFAGFP